MGFIAEEQINGEARGRFGNDLFGAFGRDFVTRDGRRVMVVALTLRQWQNLVRATGLGAQFEAASASLGVNLHREGDRFRARNALSSVLEPWVAQRAYTEIELLFNQSQVCFGPYQTISELLAHDIEASLANPLLSAVVQPGIGKYLMPGSPLYFGDAPHPNAAPAPRLGEHTDQLLSNLLGFDSAAIGKLHDAGIVA